VPRGARRTSRCSGQGPMACGGAAPLRDTAAMALAALAADLVFCGPMNAALR